MILIMAFITNLMGLRLKRQVIKVLDMILDHKIQPKDNTTFKARHNRKYSERYKIAYGSKLIKSEDKVAKIDLTDDIAQELNKTKKINKAFNINKLNQLRDKRAVSYQDLHANSLSKHEDNDTNKNSSHQDRTSENTNDLAMIKIKSAFDAYPKISFNTEMMNGK
jgi:hypothetical protein